MHYEVLKALRDKAAKSEEFWFEMHADVGVNEDREDYHDYGWLWMHYRQAREKLDAMLFKSTHNLSGSTKRGYMGDTSGTPYGPSD